MNKIYNNLTIENIIKTDWFNQFESFQKNEIHRGLQENLDISWYAKPEFDDNQMAEIRFGLEYNLDVSKYAKSELSWKQMREIREQLLQESTQL